MDEQLKQAIEQLSRTISRLSDNLGRGVSAGATGGVNRGARGIGRGAEQAVESAVKRLERRQSKVLDAIAKGQKINDDFYKNINKANSAIDDHADAVKEAAKKEKEAAELRAEATRDVVRGLGRFGRNLFSGSENIQSSLSSLAYSTQSAAVGGNKFAGILNTLALAAGFTFGQMQKFAETAQKASGMVDLSVLRVGAITVAKQFSSLNDSFVKVINDSSGSFRVFGGTTKEAIDNLSALSKGLRLGSSSVKASMQRTLGKDVVKDFDRASEATAALGLTQEEQAKLQASIMQSVRLNAKNEVDAQRMLVKQYADTTESARKLSNQMGVSAKEILESIDKFRRSTSGQIAQMKGVQGAQDILQYLQIAMPGISEDVAQRMALDFARGQGQAALSALGPEYQPGGQVFLQAVEQARRMQGGLTQENLAKALKDNAQQFAAVGRQFTGEAGEAQATALSATLLGPLADQGIALESFATRLQETDAQREAREKTAAGKAGKTEADNVKTMSNLASALDSLKGSVNILTGAIMGLTGAIGLLIASSLVTGGVKAIGKSILGMVTGGGAAAGGALNAGRIGFGMMGPLSTGGIAAGTGGMTTAAGYLGGLGAAGTATAAGTGGMTTAAGYLGGLGAAGTATAAGTGLGGLMARYGGKLAAGSIGKAAMSGLKGFGIGAVGGLIGDLAADALGRETKAGATADVAGTAASWAGTGAMLGSFIPGIGTAIGAGVGGLLGLGKGLWSNASALFGPSTADVTSGVGQDGGDARKTSAEAKTNKADMEQIMAYLSSISNDISAIRSNTRGDNATVPVRLG